MLHLILSLLLISTINGVPQIENEPFLKFTKTQEQSDSAPRRVNQQNVGVKITADKYLVLDVASGKILAEQNSNISQPIASITKLMTALVILDQDPDWQKSVELLERDETQGAHPHIYRGEQVEYIDLWKTALISSDNNSIMAMVRALGLSIDEFVELMNSQAHELGLYNTIFADPTGLSELNQSTATDVAKLIYHTMRYNQIRETVLEPEYVFRINNSRKVRRIITTDILINSFLNSQEYGYELIGGKTGYLPEAGYCLAVDVARNNHSVIFVVLDSHDINARFQDTKVLADWIFANYEW